MRIARMAFQSPQRGIFHGVLELMTKTKSLSIDVLVLDADTQSRLSIHDETVLDYAELIEVDTTAVEWPFPPVDVFHDGSRYMVADGFHRVLAAAKTKRASIPCIVHKGTATDALFFAMTANDNHGLRMTRADKRANVELLLDDYPKMTQKLIAETVGVCVRTVKSIVADRKPQKVQVAPSGEEGRTELDGTEPTEETSPSEPRSGKELAGEDDGQEFVEMDYEEDRVQTALKAIGGGPTSAKPEPIPDNKPDPAKAKNLANQYRDKLVRSIDDYHRLAPNRTERDRLVKVVQGVYLW
jgi:hypothetical protein